MKKLVALILAVLAGACSFCFFGCADDEKQFEGIYYFHDGSGEWFVNQSKYSCRFDAKDEETGLYPNVAGGVADFANCYIELKDGKMTVHGSLNYAFTPAGLKLIVIPDGVIESEYTIGEPEDGIAWRKILTDGEYMGFTVSGKDESWTSDYAAGSISYSQGKQGAGTYVIYNWTKTRSQKFLDD